MSEQPKPVIVTLEPLTKGWQAPADKRLARALKTLLRAFGWRCTAIKPKEDKEHE